VSPLVAQQSDAFWTIDCASFRSAEELIREVSGNASLSSLVNAIGGDNLKVQNEPLLCGTDPDNTQDALAYSGKEVVTIRVNREQRRVDLKWKERTTPPRWQRFPHNLDLRRIRQNDRYMAQNVWTMSVGQGDVEVIGISNEIAVRAFGHTYVLPGTPVAELLTSCLDKINQRSRTREAISSSLFIFELVQNILLGRFKVPIDLSLLRKLAAVADERISEETVSSELVNTINGVRWTLFDTSAWDRGTGDDIDF
jgi:hypothetical protein